MDVFAGGKIHHGVGPPLRRPTHLLDLLFNRRGYGTVADVRVDLDQEVAADRHRLDFRVIDVGGNYGSPASHFLAHEFGRYIWRDTRAAAFASMLMIEPATIAGRSVKRRLPSQIFANGHEFHFGRDNASTGVMHLSD